jgi:hypothetical protein
MKCVCLVESKELNQMQVGDMVKAKEIATFI